MPHQNRENYAKDVVRHLTLPCFWDRRVGALVVLYPRR